MEWLGLLFNTRDMTLSIPHDKLAEIHTTLLEWSTRKVAHKQQLQSLLGSLFHVAQCVAPARLFLNRMLSTLRSCPLQGSVLLTDDFRKDLSWFTKFMTGSNGVYLLDKKLEKPVIIKVDSCLTGGGGWCRDQAYSKVYSPALQAQQLPICALECMNALAAFRQWAPSLNNRHVQLQSDSATAVAVLQAGRGRDPFLQAAAREFWLLAARHSIELRVVHISGSELLSSVDALSRSHTHSSFKQVADSFLNTQGVKLINISDKQFLPPLNW
jgi:hypothetical protein